MSTTSTIKPYVLYDRLLLLATIGLLSIGLMMVASASMVISDRLYDEPFYYLLHQFVYLCLGVILSWYLFRFRIAQWTQVSAALLLGSLLLLALVLIPGIGHEVNGSMRWIGIG